MLCGTFKNLAILLYHYIIMLIAPTITRNQLYMPIAHTLGYPYALHTLFLDILEWCAEKHYVMLWHQIFGEPVPFDGSRGLSFSCLYV